MFRQEVIDRRSSPEELNRLLSVTGARAWLIMAAIATLILAGLLWAGFTSVTTQVPARGVLRQADGSAGLGAILYVGLSDSARITPGMTVEISPSGVERQQAGVLLGTVLDVTATPASSSEVEGAVGNSALAQMLVAQGALIPVRVALTADAANATGYRWSMGGTPPLELRSGMFCDAQVTISSRRLINLIFP